MQTLQVRTAADPAALIPEVRSTVHSLAPDMPLWDVKPMQQAIETLNGLLMFEIGAGLAAIMGCLGLVLSIVGVYGVISYSAAQRTQEIGIRMALGARPLQIIGMVLRQGVWIVAVGVAVGLTFAFALARAAAGVLVISPNDPLTYITVSGVLTAVALAACYIPARRTVRVDPLVALRNE
jgi:ABC-type antimicrobial peptide transport system permease subunit